jgi:HAL2 family 3'(2'),5'-bisphosphate nucleotidase
MVKGFRSEADFPEPVRAALAAVRRACAVARTVQEQMTMLPTRAAGGSGDGGSGDRGGMAQTKPDSTPVTVADYAAQAIILSDLSRAFPEGTLFLAEESSAGLLVAGEGGAGSGRAMARQVGDLTGIDAGGGGGGKSDLERAIDIGQSYHLDRARRLHLQQQQQQNAGTIVDDDGTLPPPDRFWCLDPIDGTKGFLRGGQYCVALALLEAGVPTIGILACPNLAPSPAGEAGTGGTGGCIFVACRGQGCYEVGMAEATHLRRLGRVAGGGGDPPEGGDFDDDPTRARFCVGVEQGFNDPDGLTVKMGEYLHGALEEGTGEILHCSRMDSQVKYGVIARGEAEFYVRLPKTHRDYIWDVAAGALCLEEVGGKVTDLDGRPLDFAKGPRLPTVGILGARTAALHDALLDAYRRVGPKSDDS